MGNLHKKFGSDSSKIVDFFLMSNFWWSFLSFLILLKTKKIPPKVRHNKKSAIFKISSLNFLCKLSTPKNPSTSILEPKLGHYLTLCSFFFIIFRLVSKSLVRFASGLDCWIICIFLSNSVVTRMS